MIVLMFRTNMLLWDVLSTNCVWSTISAGDIGAEPRSAAGQEQLMQLLCEVNGIDASGSERHNGKNTLKRLCER